MKRKVVTPAQALENLTSLADDLEAMSRAPFKRMLALILGVQPSRSALQKFANKSPDRWAQAVSILGGLAGYERGVEMQVNLFSVRQLSDAQLLAEATKLGVNIIEGEALTVAEDGPRELTPPKSGPTPAAEAAATVALEKPRNPAPLPVPTDDVVVKE